jgi:hypothetical protein
VRLAPKFFAADALDVVSRVNQSVSWGGDLLPKPRPPKAMPLDTATFPPMRCLRFVPYGYIVIVAVVALTLHFVFTTSASIAIKSIALGVLAFCLACLFWLHRFSMAALFLLVALGIFISFYRIWAQARSSNRKS